MIDNPVLVLNQSYEPLNVCRVKRAIILIYQNKAEMLENGLGVIRSADAEFPIPSVIRLGLVVRRPHRSGQKLSRLDVFRRDQFHCQYCGKAIQPLTLDHVIPKYRGGQHTWENIVSACVHCNRRKAGRTPQEAGMKLIRQPERPHSNGLFYIGANYRSIRHEWQKYLPQ